MVKLAIVGLSLQLVMFAEKLVRVIFIQAVSLSQASLLVVIIAIVRSCIKGTLETSFVFVLRGIVVRSMSLIRYTFREVILNQCVTVNG